LQRGAWLTAVENLDRAIAAGHPDQNRLRLEKVRARCALHEVPEALAQLRELAARPDLGELEGPVLLWQADIALTQSVDDSGLAMVRKARQLGLARADDEYAQALLAKTVPEAADHLRRALEHDRYHHRAHAMLGLLLVAQGETTEGRERVLLARRLFPDDPNFAILLGLLQARAGNLKAAHAEVDPVQEKLGPRQMAAVRAVLELAHDLCQIGDVLVGALTGQDRKNALPTIMRLSASGQKAVAAVKALRSGAGEGEGGLFLATPPALSDALERVAKLSQSPLFLANPAKAAEDLRQLTMIHPDGLLLLLRGVMLANDDRMADAETPLRQASERPSFVPIRRGARFALLFCLWQLYEKEEDRSSTRAVALKREALEIVHELVRASDQRNYEPRLTAAVALAMKEFDLARWIVAEWQKHAGTNDLEPIRKRMLVEFEAGDYDAALKAAKKVLEVHPNDKSALNFQEGAIRRLRARAKDLPSGK
jgi:tetratricopeptide (TPR) repeat protein